MKTKKRKINVKRVAILIILLLLIIIGGVLAVGKLTKKEGKTKEVKEVASIDAYGYTLRDNATAYYKKLFKELEKTLNKDEVDEDKYSELVAQMFLADFFNLDNKISKNDIQNLFRQHIQETLNRKPDIYNGYQTLDLEKIENIISYIASKVKNLTITSLNKYLWYIDMLSFNQRGISITGLTYEHEKFGPTIINQEYNEISLLDDKYKREDYENENGTITKIVSNKNYNLSQLNKNEIKIINSIIKLLKDKNVTEISGMSHKEEGWKRTKRYENISFEYAMNLKIE